MWTKLSKADEILDPERAEIYKQKRREREERRAKYFRIVTRNLLNNEDFCGWLSEMMIMLRYWRQANHELTPYEQGRKAAIHEIVESVLMYGGEEAEAWFAERAGKFAKWMQQTERQD